MFRRFWTDKSGNFAMMLVVMTIPLMLALGLAVDYSRWISAKARLQNITDAAALGTAASSQKDDAALKQLAHDILATNGTNSQLNNISVQDINVDNNRVDIRTEADIPSIFMSLAGIRTLGIKTEALAERAVTGAVEVALVLDNTDSMNYDDKIGTLKTAASNLVTKLHGSKDASVRISLVPYAEQINIGTANRNAAWLSVPDDYTKTTTTSTAGYWTQPTKSTGVCKTWKEAGSQQVEKDGVWVTQTWPRSCSAYEQVNNGPEKWIEPKTTTTNTNYKWYGCVGSRVVGNKLVLDDLSPNVRYPGYVATGQKCLTEIIPLTDDESKIQAGITGMITSRSGYTPQTYIPGGMMWGINVLSKSQPYSEGLEYDPDNAKPRKVIVLMTDGLNTRRVNLTGTLNLDYLKGGALVGDTNTANASQRLSTNTDTMTLCDYAKSKKIEIFTVAFKVDDTTAKTMLESCATDKAHYYDATDSTALLTAFSGIAQSLSQVRLAR